MDRKKDQADLLFKLGAFLGPLYDLVTRPDQYDKQRRARVFARCFAEQEHITEHMAKFVIGEPGHRYLIQNSRFQTSLHGLVGFLYNNSDNAALKDALQVYTRELQAPILEVPVEGGSTILEAYSPFTAYCRLKDICGTALQTLIWTDRYFDSTVFHRYLRDVRSEANITLVILDSAKIIQSKDKARQSDFMDISRLFASERGKNNYRLIAHPDFHDRWMRCDGQIYSLGGSVKDAGQKSDFAIGRIDPNIENLKIIDDMIGAGNELFGPNAPTHP